MSSSILFLVSLVASVSAAPAISNSTYTHEATPTVSSLFDEQTIQETPTATEFVSDSGYEGQDDDYYFPPGYYPFEEYYQKRDAEAWSPYIPPGHSSPGHYGGNWMLNPWNAW